jgi:hypothetical protein
MPSHQEKMLQAGETALIPSRMEQSHIEPFSKKQKH